MTKEDPYPFSNDEVSIARRKKIYDVRKDEYHVDGYPLSNEQLQEFNDYLEKLLDQVKDK